jgi:hypothetical protein
MDTLPHFERVLGVSPAPGSPEAERREVVAGLWPARVSAAVPDIEAELQRIDPRFSCELVPESETSTAKYSRWFESHGASEGVAFGGGRNCSALAGPTTRYMLTAFLEVSDPENLSELDLRSVASARKRLRSLVPSWEGFEVSVSPDGFLLGVSPLGLAVL